MSPLPRVIRAEQVVDQSIFAIEPVHARGHLRAQARRVELPTARGRVAPGVRVTWPNIGAGEDVAQPNQLVVEIFGAENMQLELLRGAHLRGKPSQVLEM